MPTDREIQERFNELPADVQQAIQSANITAALESARTAHGLHIDQLGALEDEALLVMLGFSNPAEFPERLQKALSLDHDMALQIAEELSQKLFMPIRASMRSYMEERLRRADQLRSDAARVTETPPAPPTPLRPTPTASAPATSITATPTVIASPAGGKTILPASVQPVLHPADARLAAPTVTIPSVTAYDASRPARYSTDPYREPVE